MTTIQAMAAGSSTSGIKTIISSETYKNLSNVMVNTDSITTLVSAGTTEVILANKKDPGAEDYVLAAVNIFANLTSILMPKGVEKTTLGAVALTTTVKGTYDIYMDFYASVEADEKIPGAEEGFRSRATLNLLSTAIVSTAALIADLLSLLPIAAPVLKPISIALSTISAIQSYVYELEGKEFGQLLDNIQSKFNGKGIGLNAQSLFATKSTLKYGDPDTWIYVQSVVSLLMDKAKFDDNTDANIFGQNILKIINASEVGGVSTILGQDINAENVGTEALTFINKLLVLYEEEPYVIIEGKTDYIGLVTDGVIKLSQKIENNSIELISLSGKSQEGLLALGQTSGYELAMLYAIVHGNSFAIVNNNDLYQSHNQKGELDVYNPDTGKGQLTAEYLVARTKYLAELILLNDMDYTNIINTGTKGEHVLDMTSENEFGGDLHHFSRIIFGTDKDDAHIDVSKSQTEDNLGSSQSQVFAGKGNDIITLGGAGSDYIEGGEGFDTYNILAGGNHTIFDSDAKGVIKINGNNLTQAIREVDGYWLNDQGIRFIRQNENLRISATINGVFTTVIIRHFFDQFKKNNGVYQGLGIELLHEEKTNPLPPPTHIIMGDRAPVDTDLSEPGVQLGYDSNGNVIVNPQVLDPGREDTLYDTLENDWIYGFEGDDLLVGGKGGDDHLFGGEGDDTIKAGLGDDTIVGGSGVDILSGGSGRDIIFAGDNHELTEEWIQGEVSGPKTRGDFLDGGDGDDVLVGSDQNDSLFGGKGDDVIYAGDGDDNIFGDGSTSSVKKNWQLDRNILFQNGITVYSWSAKNFNYQEFSQGGNDIIYAGAGNDWVFAGRGNDFVDTGSGDDVVFGEEGNDEIWGGDGDDILMGDNGAGSSVGAGDDTLHGGKGNDELWGDAGNDVLYGDEGDDVLIGDGSSLDKSLHGNDYLDGGTGDDELIGGGGNDILYGGEGNDRLYGDGGDLGSDLIGNDYLDGGTGDDELIGGGGDDILYGGEGNDRLFGDGSDTDIHLIGDDYLDGGAGDDYLWGGAGNDHLFGGEGNDYLDGGEGDDYLSGGSGNDILVSQAGNDILLGGTGDDDYLISLKDGNTVTVNDTTGWDRIKLNGASFADAVFTRTSSDLTITTSDGTLIVQNYKEIDWITFDDQNVNVEIMDIILSGELAAEAGSGDVYLESFHKQITTLVGQEGNDHLVANFEGMTLKGGSGNDYYYLSHADTVIEENEDDGSDTVYLSGNTNSYTLGQNLENLSLGYEANVSQINGNTSNNWIEGNSGSQVINGGAGDDYIVGGGGNDTFNGGEGMDYLEGGVGQDTYIFNLGDSIGKDSGQNQSMLLEMVVDSSMNNIISFGIGITPDDITFTQMGKKQLLQYSNQDSVIIPGGSNFATFKFADGSEYTFDQLKQIQLNNGSGISTGGTGEQPERQDYSNYTLGNQKDLYEYKAVYQTVGVDDYGRPILMQTGWVLIDYLKYNTPPAVKNITVDTQFVYAGDEWQMTFAKDTFIDADGDRLNYSFSQRHVIGNYYDSSWISFNSNTLTASGSPHLLNSPQWDYGIHNLSIQATDGKGGIAELNVDLIVGIRQDQQRNDMMDVILGSDGNDVITSGRGDIVYGRDGNDHFHLSTYNDPNIPEYVDTVFIGGKGADSYYVEKNQQISISDEDKSNILVLGAGLRKEDMRMTKYYGFGRYGNQISFVGSDTVIRYEQWHLFDEIRFSNGDVLNGQNLGAMTIQTEVNSPVSFIFDSGSAFETNPNEYHIMDIEHATYSNPDKDNSGFDLIGKSPSANGIRFLDAYLLGGSALPSWLQFDYATGRLFGTALETDIDQSFIVTIKTMDKDGVEGYFDVPIDIKMGTVSNNLAPIVENIQSDLSINEKNYFSIVLPENLFSDPDGDQLAFSITLADGSALPSWLSYNATSRTLSGVPQNNHVGDLNFKIIATDPKGLSASQEFKLTVNNVNDAPSAHGSLAEQTLKEGESWQFTLPSGSFVDIDKGDVLTYSLKMADGSDVPSWLQIDPQTGFISGIPTDSGNLGVLVVATDKAGANASQALDLNIDALGTSTPNRAPEANNNIDLGIQLIYQDQPWSYQLSTEIFVDPDGDVLSYQVVQIDGSELPSWLTFDSNTGTLSGTVNNDDAYGWLYLKIIGTDQNGLSAERELPLYLENVNDAPTVTGEIEGLTVKELEGFEWKLPDGLFTDIDQWDKLSYAVTLADGSELPLGMWFNDRDNTFYGMPNEGTHGKLSLKITATDLSGESASLDFDLTIDKADNRAPIVNDQIGLDMQFVYQDQPWSYQLSTEFFVDPDKDILSYRVVQADGSELPSWLTFDPNTRILSGTLSNADADGGGIIDLKVIVTDPSGLSAERELLLALGDTNDAPIVTGVIEALTIKELELFQWQVSDNLFTDIDKGDKLSYTVTLADGSQLPYGLHFDSLNNVLSGVPTEGTHGKLSLKITATDLSGESAFLNFDITIDKADNCAPIMNDQMIDQSVDEKSPFSIVLPETLFSGPDGDQLAFNITLADGSAIPSWLSYDSITRTLSGTPQNDQVGDLNFKITAEDPKGLSASQEFKLTVNNVNDVPVTHGFLLEQTLKEGEAWQFALPLGSFSDVDKNDVLTYSLKMSDGSAIPSWLKINAQTGLISGNPIGASSLNLIVVATDTAGSQATHNFNIKVVNNQDVIYGTSGNDNIAGKTGDTIIYGGAGNDTITDNSGNNTIYGGDGNDIITGKGTIIGGKGNDTIRATVVGSDDVFVFNLGDGQDAIINQGGVDKIIFGEGITSDMISYRRDGSNLYVVVGDKGDQIALSNYFDTSKYSNGQNIYQTISRFEFVDGSVWEDIRERILTQYYPDAVHSITGTPWDDIIYAGSGNDTITDNSGNNTIYGGDGNDIIAGKGTIIGGKGNDTIRATVVGSDDVFVFNLGDGQDAIINQGGVDKIIFGEGITSDMISYRRDGSNLYVVVGDKGDQIALSNYFDTSKYSNGQNIYQTISRFEFVDGSVWEDIRERILTQYYPDAVHSITGTPWDDIIYAGSGNDTITDNSGNNTIYGGDGNDIITGKGTIIGGKGNDTIRATVVGSDDVFVFNLGDGQDAIINQGGVDKIIFGEGITSDMISYRRDGSNLYVVVGDKGDQIALSNYFDTSKYSNGQNIYQTISRFEFVDGSVWEDIRERILTQYYPDAVHSITGTPWDDIIYAGSGNDTITDNSGNNTIYGGDGNDIITGKGTIIGGKGNDTIRATVVGSDDVFVFNLGDGQDAIINQGGVDKIIFGEGITSDMISYRRDGSNLYVVVGDKGDQIALSNYFDASKYSNGQNIYQTIHDLEFADGSVWKFFNQETGSFIDYELQDSARVAGQVNNLISAMAIFSASGSEGSMLPVNNYNPAAVTLAASGF